MKLADGRVGEGTDKSLTPSITDLIREYVRLASKFGAASTFNKKHRLEFERWVEAQDKDLEPWVAQFAWQAWQAARGVSS